MDLNRGVYVLRLGNGKLYVGYSENLSERTSNHRAKASRKFGVDEVLLIEPYPGSVRDLKDRERELTLELMEEYGYENVIGAGWTRTDEDQMYKPRVLRD